MSILQVFNAVLQLTLVIAMMAWIQWQFALVMIVIIPLSALVAKGMINKSQPYFKEQADVLGRMNGFVQENLTGFNEIKLYGREYQSAHDHGQKPDLNRKFP